MPSPEFNNLVAQLDRRPDLHGKRVADIPELADFRLKFRRSFYRWANVHFAMAIFNLWLAVAAQLDSPFWQISTIGAAVAIWAMVTSERCARSITRQLHRPAAVQMARDLLEIRD